MANAKSIICNSCHYGPIRGIGTENAVDCIIQQYYLSLLSLSSLIHFIATFKLFSCRLDARANRLLNEIQNISKEDIP